MRRRFAFLIAVFTFFLAAAEAAPKPKLVVLIVVDQFRYDYLTRFRAEYTSGLKEMLERGAVFNRAFYQQFPTVTAVGHSIVSTGAMPSMSGIAGNNWFDRANNFQVTSVCDYGMKVVGAPEQQRTAKCEDWDPASPNRLLVSTVGDELRNRDENARVIGVSLKARSAILLSGHRAQGAYWFDEVKGVFVSSTFYFDALPAWAIRFNERKLADQYLKSGWPGLGDKWDFSRANNPAKPYDRIAASPWGNVLIEEMAESALSGEGLGKRNSTDLLAVSFSSNDYVGHATGPNSEEVHDMSLRTDKLIGKLIAAAEAQVGKGNALFVLTADHGVAPLPGAQAKLKMPGDYLMMDPAQQLNQELRNRFGDCSWLLGGTETGIYLNWSVAEEKKPAVAPRRKPGEAAPVNPCRAQELKLTRSDVMRFAVDKLLSFPSLHSARIFTREQLTQGVAVDPLGRAATNGFNQVRGPDIVWIQEPYWTTAPDQGNTVPPGYEKRGTTHSTPYNYDTHVPVIFYGGGIAPGQYWDDIAVNDIAPTLSAILDIEPPSGSSGKVLVQVVH